MVRPDYNTAQWLTYATGRLIVSNCRAKLENFSEFASSYNEDFLDALLAEIDAAEALPTEEQRAQLHKQLLEEMNPIFKTCQGKMMYLKRYIERAFAPEFWEMNFMSAGLDKYSSEMNHAEALNMYTNALSYIETNKEVLGANGNMPDAFKTGFATVKSAYADKVAAFEAAQNAALENTDVKIVANNAMYKKIIVICKDGQVIFADDETKKGEFSYEKQSELIKPVGPAGLKGKVIYLIDGKPVVGAVGEIEGTKHTATTNKEGEYDFGANLASGKFTVKWKLNDEVIAEEDVTIPAGTTVRDTVEVEVPGEPIVEVKVPGEPIV
ncbi:MAG TPA: carboxypeptidase-like regulatory domain-containing protein [Bacteroidia bacterium]|nr:carboxypeptidase-like regulatory domain-containing protein [Bacteroidia bacterium]HNU34568.1 carboxypeptidase-like regulatory domain-containing protein [Bacteroidia bacterium]